MSAVRQDRVEETVVASRPVDRANRGFAKRMLGWVDRIQRRYTVFEIGRAHV